MQNELVYATIDSVSVSVVLPGRRVWQRRDATRAPILVPEWSGIASTFPLPCRFCHSGHKAINPRGVETESPCPCRDESTHSNWMRPVTAEPFILGLLSLFPGRASQ